MKTDRRWFALFVLAMAVAPCGLAQEPGTSAPIGTGEVIIFNDSGKTLIPSNQKVTDNGMAFASLGRQTYVKVAVPAGAHLLRPDPFLWKQEVRLTVEPGSTHYVVVAYKPECSRRVHGGSECRASTVRETCGPDERLERGDVGTVVLVHRADVGFEVEIAHVRRLV